MRIGYSIIYDNNLENLEKQLTENHQVELNVRTSPEKAFSRRFDIKNIFDKKQVNVLSIHYPGTKRIDDKKSIHDLKKIFTMADLYNATTVVLHPPKVKDMESRNKVREKVLENIIYLKNRFNAKPCMETFGGDTRIFTPQEIMSHNLPMVLDTTHLEYGESGTIIKNYLHNIETIHLSAREIPGEGMHLPIDSWCVELVHYLAYQNFQGNIILEYRQEDTNKMISDYEHLVKKKLKSSINYNHFFNE